MFFNKQKEKTMQAPQIVPAVAVVRDNSVQLSDDWRSLNSSIRSYRRAGYAAIRSGLLTRVEVEKKMEDKFRQKVVAFNKALISCSANGFVDPVACARKIMELNEVMWIDPIKVL